jgi:hypothetical protein
MHWHHCHVWYGTSYIIWSIIIFCYYHYQSPINLSYLTAFRKHFLTPGNHKLFLFPLFWQQSGFFTIIFIIVMISPLIILIFFDIYLLFICRCADHYYQKKNLNHRKLRWNAANTNRKDLLSSATWYLMKFFSCRKRLSVMFFVELYLTFSFY